MEAFRKSSLNAQTVVPEHKQNQTSAYFLLWIVNVGKSIEIIIITAYVLFLFACPDNKSEKEFYFNYTEST